MKIRVALLLVLLLALTACGGSGGETAAPEPRPGISFFEYSPKPFSKDMTELTVTFTTTGPAGPGREYMAWLFTGKDNKDRRCYPEWSLRGGGVPGEAGATYTRKIDTWGDFSDGEFGACFGRAELVVWTQRDMGAAVDTKVMRKVSFRILPPRSG